MRGFYSGRCRHPPIQTERCCKVFFNLAAAFGLCNCSKEEGHDLTSCAACVRGELTAADALRDVVFDRPKDSVAVIVACFDIRERIVAALRRRLALTAPQEGCDLTTGAGCVRTEGGCAQTCGDAVFDGPKHSLVIILARLDILKRIVGFCRLRGAAGTPQEGYDLTSRAGRIGRKARCAHAVGDALSNCPENRCCEIIRFVDILKRIFCRNFRLGGLFGFRRLLRLLCGSFGGLFGFGRLLGLFARLFGRLRRFLGLFARLICRFSWLFGGFCRIFRRLRRFFASVQSNKCITICI